MTLTEEKKRHFRAIGHNLKPVVTVAGKGLTDNVIQEALRALNDHELIKVKFAVGDREIKKEAIQALCEQAQATLIQTIGNIALIYLENKQAKPSLSNVKTF